MDDFELQLELSQLRSELALLRTEVAQLDDWANGVFAALQDALLPILRDNPLLAAELGGRWSEVSERFDRLETSTGQHEDFHETQELLEARKMLFRTFQLLGLWSSRPSRG
ncbi:hypothetical protein [Bordetella ansorpii]|uniref:hypothetical protein n=1 Tax=Bordetella ansorpii TaxID=288768 RepID=UPI0012E93C14|nr:hypothetical protein [Bordetella ansorpii]